MKRPFKPRIGLIIEDHQAKDFEIPAFIKPHFDVKIVQYPHGGRSHYVFDSEIMITPFGFFQPEFYQMHLQFSNPSELEQEPIWQSIYDSWYGINNTKNAEPDEYQELKKGISVLINNGHASKAREIIELLLSDVLQNDGEWMSYLALTQYLENDIESAICALRQAYLLNPNNEDILYNLGFMYKVNGEIRVSIYYFERLLKVTTNEVFITEAKEILAECYYYI